MRFPQPGSTAAQAHAPTTRAALVAQVKAGKWCTKPQAKALAAQHCTGAATHVHVVHLCPQGVARFVRVGKRGGWKVLHTFGPFSFAG